MTAGREQLVQLAGRGCASGERLVTRLAFGLASDREARQAQLHLATCPQCAGLYERLDLWRETVAALLPVPAVEQARPGAVEAAVDRIADALASVRQHGGETAGAVRQHATEATAQVKQHTTAAYLRMADPTPLAGARPGRGGGRDRRLPGDRRRHHLLLRQPEPQPGRRAHPRLQRHDREQAQADTGPGAPAGNADADADSDTDADQHADRDADEHADAASAHADGDTTTARGGDTPADPDTGADAAARAAGRVRAHQRGGSGSYPRIPDPGDVTEQASARARERTGGV